MAMIFSRRGYNQIAKALKEERNIWPSGSEVVFGIDRTITTLGELFQDDNLKFDQELFFRASGLNEHDETPT